MNLSKKSSRLLICIVSLALVLVVGSPLNFAVASDISANSVYNYNINWAVQTGVNEITVELQANYCSGCNPNALNKSGCTPFENYTSPGYLGCNKGYPDGRFTAIRLKDSTNTILSEQKMICNQTNWPLTSQHKQQFIFSGLPLSAGDNIIVEADCYCSWCGHWYPNPVSINIIGANCNVNYTGDTSAQIGQSVNISGVLKDNNGNALSGKTVTFTLGSLAPVSAVTDSNGIAASTLTIPSSITSGTYPMVTRFAGDSAYFPCSDTDDFNVLPSNTPPDINVNNDNITVNEGDTAVNAGTWSDKNLSDNVNLTASVGNVVKSGDNQAGDWTWSYATTDGSAQSQTVTINANDGIASANTSFNLTVNNVAPTLSPITADSNIVAVGSSVKFTAAFSDPGVLDSHTAVWDWGNGLTQAGTVTESLGSGSVNNSYVYNSPGVYTVKLGVTDKDGASDSKELKYVIVYDPSAGFVTGGGWINSPKGAYSADLGLTGKATFGFISKYQKGATTPVGQTEFQFQVADLNFHSNSYEWLVISGPKAQYKGSGTINGSGDYGFILTATDSQINGGGDTDKFRIKIWDKTTDTVVYDNQMGSDDAGNPTTNVEGGNIVIHKI